MTTTRLDRYEVIVGSQDVNAMVVERPGLPPLLALNERASYDSTVRAVRAIAPFADEDEVRELVRAHMPHAPRIENSLAVAAAPAGPPDVTRHLRLLIGAVAGSMALSVAALVFAHLGDVQTRNDLAATQQPGVAAPAQAAPEAATQVAPRAHGSRWHQRVQRLMRDLTAHERTVLRAHYEAATRADLIADGWRPSAQ